MLKCCSQRETFQYGGVGLPIYSHGYYCKAMSYSRARFVPTILPLSIHIRAGRVPWVGSRESSSL
jgi:hypothetical protein